MVDVPKPTELPSQLTPEVNSPAVESDPRVVIPEAGIISTESMTLSDQFGAEEQADEVRSEINAEKDPYSQSTALAKLKESQSQGRPLKIAFLDIDSTLTYPKAPAPHEAARIRELLQEQGYVTFFVTSRTEEMEMSSDEYQKSVEAGMQRRPPHLRKDSDGMHEAFPDELAEFAGLYNADGIASTTGTRVYLRQEGGGYLVDRGYEARMLQDAREFRARTNEVIDLVDPGHTLFKNPDVEDPTAYAEGKADVDKPDYRVQLNFGNTEVGFQSTGATDAGGPTTQAELTLAVDKKNEMKRRIRELLDRKDLPKEIRDHVRNMRLTDDSNPDAGRYSLYLTPLKGTKGRAVDRAIDSLTAELGVKPEDLHLFVAGDSFPDLEIGLLAGKGASVDFIVAGKSRLTGPLSHQITEDDIKETAHGEFAGEAMPIWRRFLPKSEGVMEFRRPLPVDMIMGPDGKLVRDPDFVPNSNKRTVYIADKIYPDALNPMETVRRFLEDHPSS